jgi:hypothetical protein
MSKIAKTVFVYAREKSVNNAVKWIPKEVSIIEAPHYLEIYKSEMNKIKSENTKKIYQVIYQRMLEDIRKHDSLPSGAKSVSTSNRIV